MDQRTLKRNNAIDPPRLTESGEWQIVRATIVVERRNRCPGLRRSRPHPEDVLDLELELTPSGGWRITG